MLSLHLIENFLRFQVQDKHNASSFSQMSWMELPQSNCKISKNRYNKHSTGELLRLDGQFRASILDFVFFLSVILSLPRIPFIYKFYNLRPSGADCLHLRVGVCFSFRYRRLAGQLFLLVRLRRSNVIGQSPVIGFATRRLTAHSLYAKPTFVRLLYVHRRDFIFQIFLVHM